jgi:RNA polymerase sigma factor (sigma-70 family)
MTYIADPSDTSRTTPQKSSDFEELAVPLLSSVYNFARWLTRNEEDAEDLLQESYMRALRSFDTFEPGSNFRAWLFRILKNNFLDSRVSAQHRHAILCNVEEPITELQSDYLDPYAIVIYRAELCAARAAILQLPVVFREVMVLCDLEEVSYREAADTLSIPIGTVMSRLARARKFVRKAVQTAQCPSASINPNQN